MKLTNRQRNILIGLVLGDAYLQKTGKKNARLRLEHSLKQADYINWKYEQLINIFQTKPKKIERIHPQIKQKYCYLRLQSHSSPIFGKLRKKLYDESGKRIIPEDIHKLLKSRLTLAVWYMDNGYYSKRDKSVHICLPPLKVKEIKYLINALSENFGLRPKWYYRPDGKGCQLNFTGKQKDLLFRIIRPSIIPSLSYKLSLTP